MAKLSAGGIALNSLRLAKDYKEKRSKTRKHHQQTGLIYQERGVLHVPKTLTGKSYSLAGKGQGHLICLCQDPFGDGGQALAAFPGLRSLGLRERAVLHLVSGTITSELHVPMNGAADMASTSHQILPKPGVWLWNVLDLMRS